ncbi:MAG: cbb3-type cytochrome c oxidase subunit 3 [Neomegalonema sp.]|nr:cbb3-type cytochrome c oxidase subunit 3 [Neomegalonema sp.]
MSTYETLRHFADTWFLLAMTIFFVGVVLYTLRPGSRSTHDDIADIPFRNDAPAKGFDDRPSEQLKERENG